MPERVDRRILGAIRVVDGVTGTPVRRPLRVESDGLMIRRNRAGLHVIMEAAGLDDHITEFDAPPGAPAAESLPFTVLVQDPERAYLPALTEITLPRPFDPGSDTFDLMEPIDVPLASSAARPTPLSWASLRVTVRDTATDPVRGALVQALPQGGGDRLGWGVTNDRGDVLVPVPGLPFMREVEAGDPADPDDNEIVTAETTVDVTATADPTRPWPVNPATLAAGGPDLRSTTPTAVALQPGRTDTATLVLDLT